MLRDIILIVLIILILLLFLYNEEENGGVYIKSTVDNRYYYVNNLPDKQDAANLLSQLRQRLIQFCECMSHKYPNKDNVNRLIENFKPNNIFEGINKKYTSYSLNKGEKIVFCLRHRDGINKNKLQDINTLMFVALHELAHLCSVSYQHTPEFYDNFSFLMSNAIDCKLYTPIKLPTKYCGITIFNSPLDKK